METKEGDRFYYNLHDCTLEMIIVNNTKSVRVITFSKNSGWNFIGEISIGYQWTDRTESSPYWQYLGNFSKSRNYTNLYELLNE